MDDLLMTAYLRHVHVPSFPNVETADIAELTLFVFNARCYPNEHILCEIIENEVAHR